MSYVESISYKLIFAEYCTVVDAPPISVDQDKFKLEIAEDVATATFKMRVDTPEEAKGIVGPYLDRWAMWLDITQQPGRLKFEYIDCAIIQDTDGSVNVMVGTAKINITTHPVTIRMTTHKYPDPPPALTVNDNDVLILHNCWCKIWDQGQPITHWANLFRDTIRERFNNDPEAALNIDRKVWTKLRLLVSERGGMEARKKLGTKKELTGQERNWIREVMKEAFARFVQKLSNKQKSFPTLGLDDLPET